MGLYEETFSDEQDQFGKQTPKIGLYEEAFGSEQSAKPQEKGFFDDATNSLKEGLNDVWSAGKERWNEVANPKPSYLGTKLGGVGNVISPLTSPEMVNAGAALGGFTYDVIGAGLKQGLRAAKWATNTPDSDPITEAVIPYIKQGAGYAKDAWGAVEKFSPELAADTERLLNLTGLGTAKAAISGVGKMIPAATNEQLIKGMGQDIIKGTRKSGIVPTVSRGFEDIKSFQEAFKDVVPDMVKNKKSLEFLDKQGALQKGVRPETVEEMSQVVKPRKDAIMADIVSGLEKAGAEGSTISNEARLKAINEIKKSPGFAAMKDHPEFDSVVKQLEDMESRYIARGSVSPIDYNADITLLNSLVTKKANTLADVIYIHVLKAEREALAKFMDSLGGQFQEKKTLWGKYNEIEPKIAQRANQLSREPATLGYWNMPALAEAFAGISTGHPGLIPAAAGTWGIGQAIKYVKSPNRQINKMFERVEKKMGQIKEPPPKPPINPLEGDVSGVRPTPLGLPMPERGFTLKGEPYSPDIIDVPFTSKTRPIPKQRQIRGYDQPLQLPPGGQFTTGKIVPNMPFEKIKQLYNEVPEEVYLRNLRNMKRYK